MASDSQINANRENAQSSTGPTSPAGKQRSSRNSTRIGIFAADLTHTLESYELDSYVKIIHKHLAGFDPKTTEEKWLAERIARLSFSLDRLRDMELAFLTDPDGEVATRIIRSANPLATLSIYESRLARDRTHLQATQGAPGRPPTQGSRGPQKRRNRRPGLCAHEGTLRRQTIWVRFFTR